MKTKNLRTAFCFEPGIYVRLGESCRINKELAPTARAAMGDNSPCILISNPAGNEKIKKSIKINIDNPTRNML